MPPVRTHEADGSIRSFLESAGVPKTELDKALTKCPRLNDVSVEGRLRPNVEYLRSIGVKRKDLGKMIARHPMVSGAGHDSAGVGLRWRSDRGCRRLYKAFLRLQVTLYFLIPVLSMEGLALSKC